MRGPRWLSQLLVLIAALAACGTGGQAVPTQAAGTTLTPVTFRLEWIVDGEHVCFFAALSKGYFREEGLDVQILEGAGSGTTANLIAGGSNDFGWADAGVVIKTINDGAAMQMVAVTFQRNPSVIVSLKSSNINRPQDLVGKSVGATAGEAPAQLLTAYLNANGVKPADVKIVNIDPAAKVSALLAKRVDALVGYATSEPVIAESQSPGQINVQHYADHGVVALSNAIVTSREMISSHPATVGAFVKAVQRGFQFCEQDPDGAAALLADRFPQSIKPEQAKLAVREVIADLHTDRTVGKPIGYADPQDWTDTLQTLQRYSGLAQVKTVTDYYTDQFAK